MILFLRMAATISLSLGIVSVETICSSTLP